MTTASQCIAVRRWLAVSPDGKEQELSLRIMPPTIDSDGSAACQADPGFGMQPMSIMGEDSWQAVDLAMKFCLKIARDRMSQGWKILWPDSRALVTLDEVS